MDPSSIVYGDGGGVMVQGICSWPALSSLIPFEHNLYATAFLSIVAGHVHPFMGSFLFFKDF